jgi:hypothetical protein
MRHAATVPCFAALLAAAAACTNIVTVREYRTLKPVVRTDTVCVEVPRSGPSWGGGGGLSPDGERVEGKRADPLVTWCDLYGGARVRTCVYSDGETEHVLTGNAVTGSGPALTVDASVLREDGAVSGLDLILEFAPRPAAWSSAEACGDTGFLRVTTEGGSYGFGLDDCTWLAEEEDGDVMTVKAVLPVSLAMLRDLAHGSSSSLTVAYPGTEPFTKYFTEMNDGNVYRYYTVFVVGDGDPGSPPGWM